MIPIKNNIYAHILIIWTANNPERAETFDAETGYKVYNGEVLHFECTKMPSGNYSTTLLDGNSKPAVHLKYITIKYFISGVVDLQSFLKPQF